MTKPQGTQTIEYGVSSTDEFLKTGSMYYQKMRNYSFTGTRPLLAAGRSHLLFSPDGKEIFGCGSNYFGQLGNSVQKEVHYKIDFADGIKSLICGMDTSLALTTIGHVYACGWNADGQCGNSTTDNVHSWQRVSISSTIKRIFGRADTFFALDQNAKLYGWGNFEQSQNFTPSKRIDACTRPILCEEGVVEVAVGGSFAIALMQDGTCKASGYLKHVLKDVDETLSLTKLKRIYAGGNFILGISTDSKLYKIEEPEWKFLTHLKDGDEICVGWDHNLMISNDESVE